jgi:CubicO group peptidase (beta-lactamase class C family)
MSRPWQSQDESEKVAMKNFCAMSQQCVNDSLAAFGCLPRGKERAHKYREEGWSKSNTQAALVTSLRDGSQEALRNLAMLRLRLREVVVRPRERSISLLRAYFYVGFLGIQSSLMSGASYAQSAARAVDSKALAALVAGAERSHSSALIVMHDGKLIGEWYFGGQSRKIEAMSVTKSIVNMAIGRLIDTGKIKSLDQPICDFYPEWRQGRKQAITVRHVLNHTSGLQADAHTQEIYQSPDFVQLALTAELVSEPGTHFFYNNKAVNLLAGIVRKASGQPLDEFLRNELFAPIGITDFTWSKDDAGNPQAMAGLQIHPRDLAKLGWVMADGGKWEKQQLLSPQWVRLSAQPGSGLSSESGLLWWRVSDRFGAIVEPSIVERVRAAGADQDLVEKVSRYVGTTRIEMRFKRQR